jgi:hypothetical protein
MTGVLNDARHAVRLRYQRLSKARLVPCLVFVAGGPPSIFTVHAQTATASTGMLRPPPLKGQKYELPEGVAFDNVSVPRVAHRSTSVCYHNRVGLNLI